MPEGLFPPSLSHRFPQRRIAMLLCPCKLFITVCEEHQQSNQYSSWQSHRSSELLDKVISVMSSRPRKLLSATKFCIFFFILTCVNFNFELRRLRHHHHYHGISEAPFNRIKVWPLVWMMAVNFFYLRYLKNYMYYNIYPKFITSLHRLHAYITNLIQHKCVPFTRFRKSKCHW